MHVPSYSWPGSPPQGPIQAVVSVSPGTNALTNARDFVRSIRASMTGDIIVNVAPGNYTPLALTDADAGTNGYKVRWRSTTLGGARILGGTITTGWELVAGSIYRKHITGTPSTIYENGIRARKARTPAFSLDASYPQALPTYALSEGVAASHLTLQYPVSIDPSDWSFAGDNMQVVVWSGGNGRAWYTDTIPIQSINLVLRQIMFAAGHESRYDLFNISGARFYVQGVIDPLTGPGQFYFESATGYLYYWARDGAIEDQEIIVPTVQDALTFIGTDTGHLTSNIVFDSFEIGYTDFVPWYRHASVNDNDRGGGPYDRQYSMPMAQHGAVYMENTNRVELTNCHIKCAGMHGVYKKGYNLGDIIRNTWIEKTGHSGIYVEGNYPGTTDVNREHLHKNLRINNFGELAGSGLGIVYANSGSNSALFLDIYNGPRGGIGVIAYTGFAPSDIYANHNAFDYFHIRNVMQDSGDFGAIDTFGCGTGGTALNTFRQGIIDNVKATASMTDTAPAGLYADNESGAPLFQHIKLTNIGGSDITVGGGAGNPVFTDCGPAATVDTANIGTTADFPYP